MQVRNLESLQAGQPNDIQIHARMAYRYTSDDMTLSNVQYLVNRLDYLTTHCAGPDDVVISRCSVESHVSCHIAE